MKLIRGISQLQPENKGCVATLGNFDGLHQGHQAIIEQLLERSRALGVPSVVVLFEPQPREYFTPAEAPPRLMVLRDKIGVLRDLGVDRVLAVRFNAGFCSLSAEQFCQAVLIDGLGVKLLVVVDDFRFGHDRCGDFSFLKAAGKEAQFSVENTHTVQYQGERVSSSRVRDALAQNKFELTEQLLGRPYYITGRVVHGDKIGRTMGIPTANILLNRVKSPLTGVFAVSVVTDAGTRYGVANIGDRPTVSGVQSRLEVHLLDFKGDLYGQRLSVRFHHKLRQEQKFNGLEALKAQIAQDIHAAKHFFHLI